jgi:hypothetical protein
VIDDVLAIGLTWFAVEHPFIAAAIVVVLAVIAFVAIRWLIRALRAVLLGAQRQWSGDTDAAPRP